MTDQKIDPLDAARKVAAHYGYELVPVGAWRRVAEVVLYDSVCEAIREVVERSERRGDNGVIYPTTPTPSVVRAAAKTAVGKVLAAQARVQARPASVSPIAYPKPPRNG